MKISIKSAGFSLVEIIIVLAISFSLLSFMTLNVTSSLNTSNTDSTTYTFVSDFKNQQTKAMVGDTEGRGIPDTYGIQIASDKYILFNGLNYSAANPANFEIDIPEGYQITTTFPSSKIIFASGSGEIVSYSSGNDTVTVRNTQTGSQKVININKYGVITNIN